MSLTGRICYIEKSLEQVRAEPPQGRSEVPYKWRKKEWQRSIGFIRQLELRV
jgi:hypothetical protein